MQCSELDSWNNVQISGNEMISSTSINFESPRPFGTRAFYFDQVNWSPPYIYRTTNFSSLVLPLRVYLIK